MRHHHHHLQLHGWISAVKDWHFIRCSHCSRGLCNQNMCYLCKLSCYFPAKVPHSKTNTKFPGDKLNWVDKFNIILYTHSPNSHKYFCHTFNKSPNILYSFALLLKKVLCINYTILRIKFIKSLLLLFASHRPHVSVSKIKAMAAQITRNSECTACTS